MVYVLGGGGGGSGKVWAQIEVFSVVLQDCLNKEGKRKEKVKSLVMVSVCVTFLIVLKL